MIRHVAVLALTAIFLVGLFGISTLVESTSLSPWGEIAVRGAAAIAWGAGIGFLIARVITWRKW